MGLQFTCPQCFSTITANSQHAGKRVKCPTCGSAVQAPSGSGSRQAAPAAAGGRGGRKKKKSSGGSNGMIVGLAVGVNSFKRVDGENLNFAICSLDVQEVLSQRGQTVTAISPESVPVKISTSGFGGVESLVGTERGRLLLSQIREAIVIVAPFTYDPTGRISDYLKTTAENTILKRVGWTEIKRRSDLTGSTAIVTVLTYFQVGDQTTDDNLVSELVIRIQVVARDVSKEGVETIAIVLDEKDEVATASVRSLVEGRVSRTMENGVRSFFNKFVGDYRRAVKEADAAP